MKLTDMSEWPTFLVLAGKVRLSGLKRFVD